PRNIRVSAWRPARDELDFRGSHFTQDLFCQCGQHFFSIRHGARSIGSFVCLLPLCIRSVAQPTRVTGHSLVHVPALCCLGFVFASVLFVPCHSFPIARCALI